MIKILKKRDYTQKPWKNGLGTTEEIFIFPEHVQFPEDRFDFRLSMAEIKSDNEFSVFPGYQRLLTVIEGQGLVLNDKTLQQNEIFSFSGFEKVFCRPLTAKTVDLGLIFDPIKVDVKMEVLQFGELKLELNPDNFYFIFCSEGLIFKNQQIINRFETILIKGEKTIELKSPDVISFLITIAPN